MDGGVADAGDGGEHACPIDLLLCLLAVCGTFDYELWEIDLSCSDITLYGWYYCWEKKMARRPVSDCKGLKVTNRSGETVRQSRMEIAGLLVMKRTLLWFLFL